MAVIRILVVDDELTTLKGWKRALGYAGWKVWTAQAAAAAMKFCDEHTFDVVILDQFMPTMKGTELLTRIRKVQPLIRSIIVSGKLDDLFDEKGLGTELKQHIEADAYLHKPVSNDRLRETVNNLLNDESPIDWKGVAKRTVKARNVTIKSAKATSRKLNQIRKKR
jgi:DNA-binding response OmpR family regulator